MQRGQPVSFSANLCAIAEQKPSSHSSRSSSPRPLRLSLGIGCRSRSADFQSAGSQVSNLPGAGKLRAWGPVRTPGRLEIGDTADWKSALRRLRFMGCLDAFSPPHCAHEPEAKRAGARTFLSARSSHSEGLADKNVRAPRRRFMGGWKRITVRQSSLLTQCCATASAPSVVAAACALLFT